MHLYLSIYVPVKYLIVLRQASRALRNTKLAGLQATRVRLNERKKIERGGGGVKKMEGYRSQTDGWWSSTDNQGRIQTKQGSLFQMGFGGKNKDKQKHTTIPWTSWTSRLREHIQNTSIVL